jgi:uncharacterized protein (TIGR02996 family)
MLEDIAREPDNYALRSIYADWLEDNDQQEKAGYIRWALAHPNVTAVCLCVGLRDRCFACTLYADQLHSIPRRKDNETHYVIQRGMVEEVRIAHDQWCDLGVRLVMTLPLKRVLIYDRVPCNAGTSGYHWHTSDTTARAGVHRGFAPYGYFQSTYEAMEALSIKALDAIRKRASVLP